MNLSEESVARRRCRFQKLATVFGPFHHAFDQSAITFPPAKTPTDSYETTTIRHSVDAGKSRVLGYCGAGILGKQYILMTCLPLLQVGRTAVVWTSEAKSCLAAAALLPPAWLPFPSSEKSGVSGKFGINCKGSFGEAVLLINANGALLFHALSGHQAS